MFVCVSLCVCVCVCVCESVSLCELERKGEIAIIKSTLLQYLQVMDLQY